MRIPPQIVHRNRSAESNQRLSLPPIHRAGRWPGRRRDGIVTVRELEALEFEKAGGEVRAQTPQTLPLRGWRPARETAIAR